MNRERSRRAGMMTALASFALIALAACGSVSEVSHEDVTRVPTMSDAAAQATREAPASPTGGETATGSPAAEPAAPAAAQGSAPVTIVSHDIFFDPKEMTIPANTDVTIALPNEGVTLHNFSVDELGVSVDLTPGATEEVVINAPAGTYEFYCNVPGHKEAGMVGTLTVSEEAAAPAGGAPEAATAEATGATPSAPGATPGDAAVTPATITMRDIAFEPTEVTVPADSDVAVDLVNTGVILHNFSINALGISVDVAAGATEQTVINAPPGTYEFYCNVPGHKEAGMVGTLVVAAESAAPAATPGAASTTPSAAVATPGAAASAGTSPAATPAAPAAEAAPVTITSQDILFDPNEVTIPANTDVTVILPNKGVAPHNFSIDALGINVDIAPGATEETVINAPPGTYEFYCNIPGHKEAGMVGTLIVSAGAGPAAAAPAATPSTAGEAPSPAADSPVAAVPGAASPAAGGGPAASAPVEVVSHDIFFEPKVLTIPANTDVAVTLPNEGVTLHNFAIDALDISVDIAPGATEQTVINAAPGTYEYYCNVPGHKQAGMVGTLTVQ